MEQILTLEQVLAENPDMKRALDGLEAEDEPGRMPFALKIANMLACAQVVINDDVTRFLGLADLSHGHGYRDGLP